MFERSVRIDGVTYREHAVTRIAHELGGATWARVRLRSGESSVVYGWTEVE